MWLLTPAVGVWLGLPGGEGGKPVLGGMKATLLAWGCLLDPLFCLFVQVFLELLHFNPSQNRFQDPGQLPVDLLDSQLDQTVEPIPFHLIVDDNRMAGKMPPSPSMERLHRHAEAALRRALKKAASLQQKKEIEAVLKALEWPYTSADRLRRLRAIEALEGIGSPEARKVLEEMAKGAPQAPETADAKASLQRLEKRPAQKP